MLPPLHFVDEGGSVASPSASSPSSQPSSAHIMPPSPATDPAVGLRESAAIDTPPFHESAATDTQPSHESALIKASSFGTQHITTMVSSAELTSVIMNPDNHLGLFGRLPRELRNMIYAHAVDPPAKEDFVEESGNYYRDITRRRPIMQTCKDIRLKCQESYFSENKIDWDELQAHYFLVWYAFRHTVACPYFKAQGHHVDVTFFEDDDPLNLSQSEIDRLYIYLDSSRFAHTLSSVATSRLSLVLNYCFRFYDPTFFDLWRVISPKCDTISVKLWINDHKSSITEAERVCSLLRDTVFTLLSRYNSQTHLPIETARGTKTVPISEFLALITTLKEYYVTVIESMMQWWRDATARDNKEMQEHEIRVKKRKQEFEDKMERFCSNLSSKRRRTD